MADQAAIGKKFEALEEKILQLAASCNALKSKLQETTRENEGLKATVRKQNEEIKSLQKRVTEELNKFHNQDKISKIVKFRFADQDNPGGLKEKLEEYIREIDQCIAHLSK